MKVKKFDWDSYLANGYHFYKARVMKKFNSEVKIKCNPNFEKGIKTDYPRDSKGRFIKRS